jgi:hypothetical protein
MQIKCGTEERRFAVKVHQKLNGIDYLEVIALHTHKGSAYSNPLLFVHCFKSIVQLNENNVLFLGGVRRKGIKAEWVHKASQVIANYTEKVSEDEFNTIQKIEDPEKVLVIRTNSAGDFSTYELWLVKSVDTPQLPPENFDTLLSRMRFSFKIECPSDFDCATTETCPPEKFVALPAIDYMAKDYASFRRLVLDRLSLIMPEWKERNSADIGMVLVELLAYVGDHLSYYQDAVATEAYLGTARRRVSAKRHARLLDYFVHGGCNARAWICIYADTDNGIKLPKKTILLTGENGSRNNQSVKSKELEKVKEEELETELAKGNEAFETMYEITLYKSNNEISFYTWSESDCWLPAGSTTATIKNTLTNVDVFIWEKVPGDDTDKLIEFLKSNFNLSWIDRAEIKKSAGDDIITISDVDNEIKVKLDSSKSKAMLSIGDNNLYEFDIKTNAQNNSMHEVSSFSLKVGDILVLEEILSPETGGSRPNLTHRHAIRLVSVKTEVDVLNDIKVLEIAWSQEDALPFDLCLEKNGKPVSIAHGNAVLVDHGYTINAEKIETIIIGGRYYPKLSRKPLTQRGPDFEIASLDANISAASAFNYDVYYVKPDIYLERKDDLKRWYPQRDLLVSDEFAQEFVVETETDDTAYIRFSNMNSRDWTEQLMILNTNDFESFSATYRIGNGLRGNVGPYSINRMVVKKNDSYKGEGIKTLFNPMAARGGQEPESLEKIRQCAPEAFRTQQRAVIESDYADIIKRHPQIQKAVAIKKWTGSWYTIFVTIDRIGGLPVDDNFKIETVKFLNKYRLAGYDIEVNGPVYVPLKIELDICLKPGYFASEVNQELLRVFSNRTLADGRKGFFHPDNFTFGQSLYLSQVYEAAMKIEGVLSVIIKVFQRWGRKSNNELDTGVIKVGMLEIIRLDNDLNFAENGIIDFNFNGDI